jgi:phenylalanyl-tRNA synthetase beta chain
LGTNEVLTYNFVGKKLYTDCDLDIKNNYRLINALSPELEYMRSSLIPSLLEKINPNINNGYNEFGIFEINKIHNKLDFSKKENLPIEHKVLTMVLTKNTSNIFYHIKYYLEIFSKDLKSKKLDYEPIYSTKIDKLPNHIKIILPKFDVNRAALVSCTINENKFYLGIIGEPNFEVQRKLKLIQPVGIFELNLEILKTFTDYREDRINFSKYPKITQDLCFIVNENVSYEALERQISKTLEKRNLNYILRPVDIYQEKAEEKNKQVTIKILLQHKEKTLKEKDIKSIREIIEKDVKKQLGGVLKG